MSHQAISAVREAIQLARLSCAHLGEDVTNLDHLLLLNDEELPQALTVEDLLDIYSTAPAYFRR